MNDSPQKEMLDSMDIIAKGYYDKTAQMYDGLVIEAISSSVYKIKVNGQTYNLPRYGVVAPDINSTVKVFVPRNNWVQAYFIVCGGSGTTGTTNYNDLSNQPQINSVTLSGNKTSSDLGLYGTNNAPPYPVASVNTKIGAVVLTQDDVGNGTTYVQTHNDFTTAYKNQIDTNEQNIAILDTDVTDLQTNLATETTNRQNADTGLQNQINTKLETTGDGSNVTSTFATTETFTNITSGSKLSVLFGKIYTAISNLISHIANVSNPHAVTKAQVGLGNVANVLQYSADNPQINITGNAATATKATQDANGNVINTTYAPLASPALTGTPTAPTAATATSNTQIATTAFVHNAITSSVSGNVTYLSSSQPSSVNSGDMWYQIL